MKNEMIEIKKGSNVAYIPNHILEAEEPISAKLCHKEVETGIVSSITEQYVFVKFHKSIHALGWTGTTAQACYRRNVFALSNNVVRTKRRSYG